jgi:hypothetical protein
VLCDVDAVVVVAVVVAVECSRTQQGHTYMPTNGWLLAAQRVWLRRPTNGSVSTCLLNTPARARARGDNSNGVGSRSALA